MQDLVAHTARINDQLARYGVKFGIYKNGTFNERLFPFDAIARVISAEDWAMLERGLAQRVDALNAFLVDIYGPRKIIEDGIVPEDFTLSSPGYLAPCVGLTPPRASTATFQASTWCKPATAAGTCSRTTCACPAAPAIL